jgi:DNA-directed RNA polymerase III subunit RPC3
MTVVLLFVDLSRIVEASRNEEIESLVRKKYGQEAFTIFRLLVRERGPVETDKVSISYSEQILEF